MAHAVRRRSAADARDVEGIHKGEMRAARSDCCRRARGARGDRARGGGRVQASDDRLSPPGRRENAITA